MLALHNNRLASDFASQVDSPVRPVSECLKVNAELRLQKIFN